MTVETEKVDISLEAQYACVVLDVCVAPGDVVGVGTVLLTVEADEVEDKLDQWDDLTNVRIGLRYLAQRDPRVVCSRRELENYNFTEFEAFVERTAEVASRFREFDLLALAPGLVEDLRAVLFTLTRLVSEMAAFKARVDDGHDVRIRERHQNIKWRVGVQAEEALRRFERLHDWAAGLQAGQASQIEEAYVFVSYAREDRKSAEDLIRHLSERAIRFFRDERDIMHGEQIVGRVHKELSRASHVVVLISAASLRSQWVAYEVGYARGRDIAVIPYILHPGLELPSFIAGYKCLSPEEEGTFLTQLHQFRGKSLVGKSADGADQQGFSDVEEKAHRAVLAEDMLTSAEVGRLLGAGTKNSLGFTKLLQQRSELIGVPAGQGHVYPSFQVDASRQRIHPEVSEVNILLDAADDPWGVASWWVSEDGGLGARPMDLVGTEDAERVVEAARALLEETG